MNVEEKAKQFNGRSRMCAKCKHASPCPPQMMEVCNRAFIEGFTKGWREHAYQSKRKVRHECVESDKDE